MFMKRKKIGFTKLFLFSRIKKIYIHIYVYICVYEIKKKNCYSDVNIVGTMSKSHKNTSTAACTENTQNPAFKINNKSFDGVFHFIPTSATQLPVVHSTVSMEENFSYDLLLTHINEPSVHKKVRQICYKASMLEGPNLTAWLLKAVSFIDLTELGSNETPGSITEFCKKAIEPIKLPSYWTEDPLYIAGICVYPTRIKSVIDTLNKHEALDIAVVCVGAGFPSGQYPLKTRCLELQFLVESGVNEIDVVIDRSLVVTHKWKDLYNDIKSLRDACDKVCMKSILATGELFDLQDVYKASMVAMLAGSDFIKTSTGKESVNATLPAGVVMCRAIKDYYRKTGRKVGFKPAGGINSTEKALQWMVLVKEELGDEWLNKKLFRIGASSLFDKIITEVNFQLETKDKNLE